MKITTRILIVVSAIALLLVIPANLFRPVSINDTGAVNWQFFTNSYTDYLFRFSTIFSGLLLALISIFIFITCLFFKKHTATNKLLNLSIFVFVFVVGWISLPYWTNGLYRIFAAAVSSAYDPKTLIPMTLIGEIWRIPVLVLYPVILCYLLFSFIRFIVVIIRKRKPGWENVLILLYNLLIIAAYFFTPHYFYWLLD